MPELPEVETVMRGLAGRITGKTIGGISLRREGLRLPFPKNLAERLAGRRIETLARRAKYILIHLDDGTAIALHLGMSGKVLLRKEKGYRPEKHDHAIISLNGGTAMIFNDPRRFGLLMLIEKADLQNHKLFRVLGLEPLSNKFTAKTLYGLLQNKNTNVKTAIMDQQLVVGVGNIYASESLYLAGISPVRSSRKISREEAAALTKSIKQVLCAAIAAGGSTISDYRAATGKTGKFQLEFQVYGRKGKKCRKCGDAILAVRQAGRSSFYCATCQN